MFVKWCFRLTAICIDGPVWRNLYKHFVVNVNRDFWANRTWITAPCLWWLYNSVAIFQSGTSLIQIWKCKLRCEVLSRHLPLPLYQISTYSIIIIPNAQNIFKNSTWIVLVYMGTWDKMEWCHVISPHCIYYVPVVGECGVLGSIFEQDMTVLPPVTFRTPSMYILTNKFSYINQENIENRQYLVNIKAIGVVVMTESAINFPSSGSCWNSYCITVTEKVAFRLFQFYAKQPRQILCLVLVLKSLEN